MKVTLNKKLEFTGERFTPECAREIWYEHWHRYAFALSFVEKKSVIDVACGEGYGSNLLALSAANVSGFDLSETAIKHAQEKYTDTKHLIFKVADCKKLPKEKNSVDVIVSFETIEHIDCQEEMLAEFGRVLKPDGILIISSPNKKTYSDDTGYVNEFHVKELYQDEFINLLNQHFPAKRLFGQKLLFQSAIWSLQNQQNNSELLTLLNDKEIDDSFSYEPLYFIAICAKSNNVLEKIDKKVSLFGDQQESVYQHYQDEIKHVIHAGNRVNELGQEVNKLNSTIKQLEQDKKLLFAELDQLKRSKKSVRWWHKFKRD